MKIFPRYQFDISSRDLISGLVSYCYPQNRSKIEKEIITSWKKPYVKVSFTVRTALDSLLTALNFSKDDEVLMSSVNILDMVKIIQHHHLKVIGVDFKLDDLSICTQSIEKLITNRTKVLIVAQLFGVIIDLEAISKLCKKYNILLIEDCAQAFCGTKYYGSQYADISLFSFGVIKSTTALGAAVIVSKSQKHIEQMNNIEKNYKFKSELYFFKRLIKYSLLKIMLSPYLYGFFVKILKLLNYNFEDIITKLSKSFPKGNLISQIRYQPPLHLLFLLRRRLKNSKNDNYFSNREAISRDFITNLKESLVVGSMANNNSFWLIPILSENPKKLQQKLLTNGFDSTQGKQSQISICKDGNSSRFVKQVLYLPTITQLSSQDKRKLIKLLA